MHLLLSKLSHLYVNEYSKPFSFSEETPQPMEVNGSQSTGPEGGETGAQDVKVSWNNIIGLSKCGSLL